MGTTIDDIHYEEYLEKLADEQRKMVWEALQKIADSKSIDELQNGLETLKELYIDSGFYEEIKIDEDRIDYLIQELDLSLPKLRDELKKEIMNSSKSSTRFGWASIVFGLLGFVVGVIGISI